jgi:DNA-binding NarL/FixJ family response regulator
MRQVMDRRAVVLDSHPLWLEAVERVLERVGVTVVSATTSADEAVAVVERERPDMLVVGSELDGADTGGFAIAQTTRTRYPELCVLLLGSDGSTAAVAAAFEAGASAYVLKSVHPDDLAAAVRQAFGPSIYFADSPVPQHKVPPARLAASEDAGLTRREVEILRLVAEGYSNAALARLLWVTEQTIKFHLSNVYRKLGVANRTEASRWAQIHGLLSDDGGDLDADTAVSAPSTLLAGSYA